jgi:hypothetical protein
MSSDIIWIASFDIGKKNFAFCIEETDRASLLKLKKKIPVMGKKTEAPTRYNLDGTPTPKMKKILDAVCHNGKLILFKNSDLTANCADVSLDPETFHNMTDLLDSYRAYWGTHSAGARTRLRLRRTAMVRGRAPTTRNPYGHEQFLHRLARQDQPGDRELAGQGHRKERQGDDGAGLLKA